MTTSCRQIYIVQRIEEDASLILTIFFNFNVFPRTQLILEQLFMNIKDSINFTSYILECICKRYYEANVGHWLNGEKIFFYNEM